MDDPDRQPEPLSPEDLDQLYREERDAALRDMPPTVVVSREEIDAILTALWNRVAVPF